MRGKIFHNTIAKRACNILTADNWQVQTEYCYCKDNIITYLDLFAVKGNKKMACEIETTSRHALDNTTKAILVGIDLCIIVPSRKICNQIESKLAFSISADSYKSISVILLSQLETKLIELNKKH